jgi:cellulose synthase/poly-beta-1,6-N-acetylglucosamine synthase-like glycosyltransferase
MVLIKAIFWISSFLVVYPYFIYPVVLKALTFFIPARSRAGDWAEKKVTLIISAYNEEGVIEEKIKNSLSLDYPEGLLEVIVVSDGSGDGTVEAVKRFSERGVILKHYEGRIGKTSCLNRTVPGATGEIIVFTDANSRFDAGAIRELVRHFADENVGFVTGGTRYVSEEDGTESVGFYTRLEQKIKGLESRTNSCVGADGAIFAIRKGLYRPLKSTDINDLVIPFKVIQQGYAGVYSPEAFCTERTAGSTKGEFNRQVRITTRTIRAVLGHFGLLNPLRFGLFSFFLLSHKLLRLMVPPFMLFALLANVPLLLFGYIYVLIFLGQLAFYSLAWLKYRGYDGGAGGEGGLLSRIMSIPYTFTSVNLAVLSGWGKFLRGETFVTWQPAR